MLSNASAQTSNNKQTINSSPPFCQKAPSVYSVLASIGTRLWIAKFLSVQPLLPKLY